jgi:hypothetical protein
MDVALKESPTVPNASFTILLVLTEYYEQHRKLKFLRSGELVDRSVHWCMKLTHIRPLLYTADVALSCLMGVLNLWITYSLDGACIFTTNILIHFRVLAYSMIGSSPPTREDHYAFVPNASYYYDLLGSKNVLGYTKARTMTKNLIRGYHISFSCRSA